MAGFVKDALYNWRIETGCNETYTEFKDTAKVAFDTLKSLKNGRYPNAKMYCNGKLVTE